MSPLLYAVIGLSILCAILGGVAKIEHSGKLEAQAETQALGSKIETQNAAVQQLKKDGDAKVAAAQKGIQASLKATQSARSESARLRVLAGTPGKPGACPAGDAVAEVRQGLK